jgi:hypothetical protein
MVRQSHGAYIFLILFIFCLPLIIAPIPLAQAQIHYSVSQIWNQLWINKDGSIDLQCNITLTYVSGAPQGIVTVGLPKGGFQILYVHDISGSNLQYSDVSSGSNYAIDVTLKKPIVLNQPNTFIVYATVPGMVSPDSTNQGNVGMQFAPTTFAAATGSIDDIRVAIALPQGVNQSQVKYPSGVPFNNVFTQNGLLVVYWERTNWLPGQQFMVGVSFPSQYVSLGPGLLFYVAIGLVLLAVVIVMLIVILRRRPKKASYEKPQVAVEALGAVHGLTAVEAGVVLGIKPVRVLTMVLFGLLMKHRVQVIATEPVLKVKELPPAQDATVPSLRYYEIDYLKSVEPDGSFNDMRLARTFLGLRDNVDRRLRGYSRVDTMNYYKSVVAKGWDQVSRAGTPELRGDAVDQNIEWLLADDDFAGRMKTLPGDFTIMPRLGWWWYWGLPPTPTGRVGTPGPAGEVGPIPIQEFANNVVKGLEATSNNMVRDIQSFANRLAAPGQAEQRSVRGASHCVCACHACACACACVGCACACAGGGAR